MADASVVPRTENTATENGGGYGEKVEGNGSSAAASEQLAMRMRSREKSVLSLIYARQPAEKKVLLGLKKRGFGAGKYNGFGGKIEVGESIEASVVRELKEESGLNTSESSLRWCGTLTYVYDTKPKAMEVHIYDLEQWEGEPKETEEMQPIWFNHGDIPLKKMWADDEFWLLQYLDGELLVPFGGRFRFKGHEGPDSWVIHERTVESFQPRPCAALSEGSMLRPGAAMILSTVSFMHAPAGHGARPLESFLRYHLLKDFALIMIIIDNAADTAALDAVRKFPKARVIVKIRGDTLLEEQRRCCTSFDELGPLVATEVSARQMLDAELAMVMAPDLGCSWVVCLDSDELFFTSQTSVVPHFEKLAKDGVEQMTYLNHEAVPEEVECDDYFACNTLFRRHHFAVPLSPAAYEGLRFWRNRSKRGQYLLFYDNGKSACRSGLGARPKSQHAWRGPPNGCLKSRTALADPRQLDIESYTACHDPCVLHFPVCGLSWLLAKYRALGNFPDGWLGGKVKLPASFHSDARDACASGDGELEAMFRREVLLDDVAEAKRQIEAGVCLRITSHSELLEAVPGMAAVGRTVQPAKIDTPAAAKATAGPPDAGPQGIELGWIFSKSVGYL